MDPYFKKENRQQIQLSSPVLDQGAMFEHFMMSVFCETFNMRPLSEWPYRPSISEMCAALVGKVEIVGLSHFATKGHLFSFNPNSSSTTRADQNTLLSKVDQKTSVQQDKRCRSNPTLPFHLVPFSSRI